MQNEWHADSPYTGSQSATPQQLQHQWQSLIEETLGSARSVDTLVSSSLDDVKIQPLYSQAKRAACPMYKNSQWNIRQTFAAAVSENSEITRTTSNVNKQILQELEGGVSAIELTLATDEESTRGIQCHTLNQMRELFAGIHPEMIHIGLTPAACNLAQVGLLECLWADRKLNPQDIHGAFNADPLGTLAKNGLIKFAGNDWSRHLTELVQNTVDKYPHVSSLCVDTAPYHNSGASEAQELGFAIATAVRYLRALDDAKINVADAATQIEFRFSLDSDLFMSVAKLRAARQLWQQVLSHCSPSASEKPIRLQAQSGLRCISARDPWVNILRVTTQAFSAIIGGAQGFNSAAYDATCQQQTPLGRRIARNTQLILMEESQLNQVADPLRGSGLIEDVTTQLCEKAWAIFQNIEKQGGMADALLSGYVQTLVAEKRDQRKDDIASGKTSIIGVSEFANANETTIHSVSPPPAVATSLDLPDVQLPSVKPADIAAAINSGADTRSIHKKICTNNMSAKSLTVFRDSQVFENMVRQSDQFAAVHGERPGVILLTLGSASEYGARATFCANFFAAAGLDSHTVSIDDYQDTTDKKPALIVLCSSDERYGDQAVDICTRLALNNSTQVWLAGVAGGLDDQLQTAGLANQLHIKSNRVELLNSALLHLTGVQS